MHCVTVHTKHITHSNNKELLIILIIDTGNGGGCDGGILWINIAYLIHCPFVPICCRVTQYSVFPRSLDFQAGLRAACSV